MDALMPFPPVRRSIQLPNGAIDAAWQQWVTSVFQRLGGADAATITQIEADIAAIESGLVAIVVADSDMLSRIEALESAPAGSAFTYSDVEPASPIAGDRWVHSTSGIKYTRIDDGNSSQWVEL